MGSTINRRSMLGQSAAAALVAGLGVGLDKTARAAETVEQNSSSRQGDAPRQFKLGLVTYNIAREWDLATLIERCGKSGISAVEFRTTHQHGVEPSLSKAERREVSKRCANGGLIIWGLGTACEYHSTDPQEVRKNIELSRAFIELAVDLGARQIKVRPNGLPKGVPEEKTLEQIGQALRRVGQAAEGSDVRICCEMHGQGTQLPSRMHRIMTLCDHPQVQVTWNSNGVDVVDGSIEKHFRMMRPWIENVHIHDLINDYPWRELFRLLRETGYEKYTLMEIQGPASRDEGDILRFMGYYKRLWDELSGPPCPASER